MASLIFHLDSEIGGIVLVVPAARSLSASTWTFAASSSVMKPFLRSKSRSGSGGCAQNPGANAIISSIPAMQKSHAPLFFPDRFFIGSELYEDRRGNSVPQLLFFRNDTCSRIRTRCSSCFYSSFSLPRFSLRGKYDRGAGAKTTRAMDEIERYGLRGTMSIAH